jgi:hypothetical protein
MNDYSEGYYPRRSLRPRREVFGEDIGQLNWQTETERAEVVDDLRINADSRVLDIALLEHDVSTEEERLTLPYYQETAGPGGREWFASVGFSVDGSVWCMPALRGAKQGPFTRKEGRYLAGSGLTLPDWSGWPNCSRRLIWPQGYPPSSN